MSFKLEYMKKVLKIDDCIFKLPYFNENEIEIRGYDIDNVDATMYGVMSDFYEDSIELDTSNIPDNILPLYCEYTKIGSVKNTKIYEDATNKKISRVLLVNKKFYNILKEVYKFNTIQDVIGEVYVYRGEINRSSFFYFKWNIEGINRYHLY